MENERINAALHDASNTGCVVVDAGALIAVDNTFAQCFASQRLSSLMRTHLWLPAAS